MGDSRESTLQEFEDDTSLEVVANRPGKCAATRKWTGCRNWPTSTFAVQQGKCKALLLRSTDWEPTSRKEAEKVEKGLRFLVDIKLIMSLQSTFVANKVNSL